MDELEAIRARRAAITPPPWVDAVTDEGSLIVRQPEPGIGWHICYVGDMEETDKEDHANAQFIAAAPADIDTLLAVLDAVTAERDALRALLAEARTDVARAACGPPDTTLDPLWHCCDSRDLLERMDAALAGPDARAAGD